MLLEHGLLRRVQLGPAEVEQRVLRQVGGGPECAAIDRMRQPQAAVDGTPAQPVALGLCQHHGAGATVARVATLLDGRLPEVLAQQRQQGALGRDALDVHDRAALDKAQRLDGGVIGWHQAIGSLQLGST